MYKNKKIISIIPAYNEEGKLIKVVQKVPEYIDCILVIDDGSTDKCIEELKGTRAIIIKHTERKMIGAAIRTGIKYAIENKFDIITVLSGNDKDNPKELDKLLDKIIDEDYEFIQGSRYLSGGEYGKMPLHRFLFTKMYSKLVSIITGTKITDSTNGFRAYKTSIFDNKEINIEQNWLNETLEYYLLIKVLQLKLSVAEVPVTKIYPKTKYKNYTKIKPFIGWIKRLLPLFYLITKIKK
ncbi:MAG TPA: glycosyltransferase family 2 protein [bacterium]|nr:glycosyltransferase family 2 protein [bacterium]HOL48757.1 glycosyltransferase family 2 protein [bacterium]HPQ19348.1 glycosyltransferase family 2 protein [bacterium]